VYRDALLTTDGTLDYIVRPSRRRSLALRLDPAGAVRVAAPHGLPLTLIRDFVRQHLDWVRAKQVELAATRARQQQVLGDGQTIPCLGESLRLEIVQGAARSQARRDGEWLRVQRANDAPVCEILEQWYRREAARVFPQRVAYWAQQVGRAPARIVIRGQRTRWGSCSARGTVSLNWRLLQAAPEYLDYVIVHELCHLWQRNHAPRFWREVARVMPDYPRWRRGLRHVAAQFLL
jgi:hypothetical protein